MSDTFIYQTTPARNSMNLFQKLIDFLEGNPGSLRFDVVSNRLHGDDLHYITIAESKRRMSQDFKHIRYDFNQSTKSAAYGKES